MPENRARFPAPDPSEFENPRAEKIYWATEYLLDEAPETGYMKWRDMVQGWHNVYDQQIGSGESDNDAKDVAWGALAFLIPHRVNDLTVVVLSGDEDILPHSRVGRESYLLQTWNEIIRESLDEASEHYLRLPESRNLPLSEYSLDQKVEMDNPNSETFGHLQALNAAVDLKPIAAELKSVMVRYATRDASLLEASIDEWNRLLHDEYEGQDPAAIEWVHKSSFTLLALTVANSWGEYEDAMQRLNLLGEHLQEFREPNDFAALLDEDAIDARTDAFQEKYGLDEGRVHTVSVEAIVDADFMRIAGGRVFDSNVSGSYTTEYDGYAGLDFAGLVTWSPEGQIWLGHIIISQAGRNPPRSISPIVTVHGAETPAQAIMGLLEYMKENQDLISPPHNTELSRDTISDALELLRQQEFIHKLNPPSGLS